MSNPSPVIPRNPTTLVDAETGAPISADNPLPVTIEAAEPINLTGDVVVDTFGAVDDAEELDPEAASATIPSLLRGILRRQNEIAAAIGQASDAAGDPTVIGLLKQIADNTGGD